MDFATFETAVKLRDAGFPQEMKPGCVIIELDYHTKRIIYRIEDGFAYWVSMEVGDDQGSIPVDVKGRCVLCPTATDILLQLPDKTSLHRVNQDMFLCWAREDRPPKIGDRHCMTSAVEACAGVWLGINTPTKS